MNIDELRIVLGTKPHSGTGDSRIYIGVDSINVDLITATENPYKAMVNMATATWGAVESKDRWSKLSVGARIDIVRAILKGYTLPLALEAPQFTFEIIGCSRSAFDQLARARVGVTFASMGWRDNCHADISFRMPNAIAEKPESKRAFLNAIHASMEAYRTMIKSKSDWQAARSVIPISACHRFVMTINYMALRNLCSRRMMFCEQEDTVAVAWLLRKALLSKFPLLANTLRLACDHVHRCVYHDGQQLSEAFGSLFRGCGRWPEPNTYGIFNHSSSDADLIAKQLNIKIPAPESPMHADGWDELDMGDMLLFNAK